MFEVFGTRKERLGAIPPTLRVVESSEFDLAADDLPCPWCNAATSETDSRCPSCRQSFGALHLRP